MSFRSYKATANMANGAIIPRANITVPYGDPPALFPARPLSESQGVLQEYQGEDIGGIENRE